MIQFVAQRMMDRNVETLCGAACGERSAMRGALRRLQRPTDRQSVVSLVSLVTLRSR